MPLTLMYITNDPEIALIAEKSGVDWIFIDLEILGKEARQGHLDTVISRHSITDIIKIRKVLTKSKIIVRVNPINKDSYNQINEAVNFGADIIMLPYFKSSQEVDDFIRIVDGRVKTCLLLETPEAVVSLDAILDISGIDYVHIGLNDLHLGYKMSFMFELLSNGTVEKIIDIIKKKNIIYGFGGIARLGQGMLPSEHIIMEHYRLNSSLVILSRSFFNQKNKLDNNTAAKIFSNGIQEIRDFEMTIDRMDKTILLNNSIFVKTLVEKIIEMNYREKK